MSEVQTTGLTDFLLARIAEDEERAESWRMAGVTVNILEYGDTITFDYEPWNRILAECEAKRLLIKRVGNPAWAGFKIMALPYADHPDYRDEWRP